MRALTLTAIACLAIAASDCQGPLQGNDGASVNQETGTRATDLAQQLVGMRFVSKEKHDCGLGPTGVVMGYWRLRIDEDYVSWDFSDTPRRAPYTVEPDGTIKTPLGLPYMPIEGKFFPERGELLWDGVWYTKAD